MVSQYFFLKLIMKFRNDISFLRAMSVVAVLLYHFKFSFFRGGFIGVDIFFVISGYLMTRIILSGLSDNNFSLSDFYKKRLMRIFPALLAMITFFGILIYFCIPTQWLIYTKQCFASSLFFPILHFITGMQAISEAQYQEFILESLPLK